MLCPTSPDSRDYEAFGSQLVDSIPSDPVKYRRKYHARFLLVGSLLTVYSGWLKRMREKFAAKERYFETFVFPITGAPTDPRPSRRREFVEVPSPLPRSDKLSAQFYYLINLDDEIFTVDFGAHFKLGSIPRENNLRWSAIVRSVYYTCTVKTEGTGACDENRLASPAIEIPEPVPDIGYASRTVTARTDIQDARKHWLRHVLAGVDLEYYVALTRLGREWAPSSFPFRELIFSFLWIAAGKAKFLSFPARLCHPGTCPGMRFDFLGGCERFEEEQKEMTFRKTGYTGPDWAGESAPLLEFGTLFHQHGQVAGVSPAETMYWFDDVLVSLVLQVDGAAVTAAVTWGLQHGRSNFQLIVISLFDVVLAEVSTESDKAGAKKPFVKASHPLELSSQREKEKCMSTHPKERPEHKEGMEWHSSTSQETWGQPPAPISQRFPGYAALVNFLDVAARRHSAAKSRCVLPPEILCHILDDLDYETWRTCSTISPVFWSYSQLKYRIDDDWRMVPDSAGYQQDELFLFSFDVENRHTRETALLAQKEPEELTETEDYHHHALRQFNWMPIVGAEPRALMANVLFEFYKRIGDDFIDSWLAEEGEDWYSWLAEEEGWF